MLQDQADTKEVLLIQEGEEPPHRCQQDFSAKPGSAIRRGLWVWVWRPPTGQNLETLQDTICKTALTTFGRKNIKIKIPRLVWGIISWEDPCYWSQASCICRVQEDSQRKEPSDLKISQKWGSAHCQALRQWILARAQPGNSNGCCKWQHQRDAWRNKDGTRTYPKQSSSSKFYHKGSNHRPRSADEQLDGTLLRTLLQRKHGGTLSPGQHRMPAMAEWSSARPLTGWQMGKLLEVTAYPVTSSRAASQLCYTRCMKKAPYLRTR